MTRHDGTQPTPRLFVSGDFILLIPVSFAPRTTTGVGIRFASIQDSALTIGKMLLPSVARLVPGICSGV
ncbi:MAG: hypothetical protein HQ518_26055 [Rhodopirellula sp.]|nr:hypothetical protein [Rhodopirellula sp.]